MDTVTFSNAHGLVTLPAPEPGAATSTLRHQGLARTAAGTRVVADGGVAERRVALSFPALTDAERAALDVFFHDAARGMLRPFVYLDSSGQPHTVRFAEPSFAWTSPAPDVHDVTLALENVD